MDRCLIISLGHPGKLECLKGRDSHAAGLTVREHLLFQCRFRMGMFSRAESEQRVDALITELGLMKCKNTLIGNIGAGISGGSL